MDVKTKFGERLKSDKRGVSWMNLRTHLQSPVGPRKVRRARGVCMDEFKDTSESPVGPTVVRRANEITQLPKGEGRKAYT